MTPSVLWFRRDLRLRDNPALLAAVSAAGGDGVVPLFVVDPALWGPAGPSRRAYLSASLRALDEALQDGGGRLVVRHGDPVEVVPALTAEVGAGSVHVAADFGPHGRARDERVEKALAEQEVSFERLGSPYAVAPGTVLNGSGKPYQVFTPFSRAWREHGWHEPAGLPARSAAWRSAPGRDFPDADVPDGLALPSAGEEAARQRWEAFLERVEDYAEDRDRPDRDGTSRMSPHLKWGEIHPRTLLADLADHTGKGATTYRNELAWREFYADVLWNRPDSAREYYRPELAGMAYDPPTTKAFEAWQEGRTGYPVVDAGMRQLRATGWMHNRVRMIVASFLVKDLHVEWQHGARHFLHWLVDGDLASNNHGWQWTAGSGTDASPFFRVFNPTTQGRKFDPAGDYVRRWVPELADLSAKEVHDPSARADGPPEGYPPPVVDHAEERREALDRYEEVRR
ncbi:MAG: deoxyribodipyrimidine photo-lyase [Nocardioides sp.]|nr:deoxyribodipyrimidine photo-lyase [Nocardioides sp.]